MIYIILRVLIFLPIGIISVISIGEIFAKSHSKTKFANWWRRNIIYDEPNK
jgi:hypothetical protein